MLIGSLPVAPVSSDEACDTEEKCKQEPSKWNGKFNPCEVRNTNEQAEGAAACSRAPGTEWWPCSDVQRREPFCSGANRCLWLIYKHPASLGTFPAKQGEIKELILPNSALQWFCIERPPPQPSVAFICHGALVLIKIPDWHCAPCCSLKLVNYSALITPLNLLFYRHGPLLCLRLIKQWSDVVINCRSG